MKYIAPEMEMKSLEVEDIIMSDNADDKVTGDGTIITPEEEA